VVRSFLACTVTASPPWFVPIKVIELKPVSAVVGNVPTSPVIVVGPVLVIPAPARTAKLSAVPRPIGGCAAWALPVTASITSNASNGSPTLLTWPLKKAYLDPVCPAVTWADCHIQTGVRQCPF
jgi:hypothetical protein